MYICDCEKVRIQGVKIVRSACYTLMFERCRDIMLSHVSVRAGQDGFRFTDCHCIKIDHCDVRSGDDCMSGSGNCDVGITDTMLNTPGDATMLFSCVGLRMKRSRIWSACEYPAVFQDTKRYSLCHTALVHGYESSTCGPNFSDDWLIEDTVFENVQGVYRFENIIHGRKAVPARRVVFNRVHAVNMVEPILIAGDPDGALSLEIRHSTFHFAREDADCTGLFLDADAFDAITLEDVRLRGCCDQPLRCRNGASLTVRDVVVEKDLHAGQVCADAVPEVLTETTAPTTLHTRFAVPGSTSQVYPKDATEEFRGPLPYIPHDCSSL